MHYFEPINKYQNLSFTDIKDLLIEKEHFIDIFLINKNQHKVTINIGLIGFMYYVHSNNIKKNCTTQIR